MNLTHLIPLVDADYIVYRVGFAVKDDEPVENALSTVKACVHNIWDRFPDAPKPGRLFLSGKGNFRDKLATIQVYKGNRDPANKPYYYNEIREYLINVHGAEVVQGMEAEDAVGILQYGNKDRSTCIVAVDKDLDCVPGFHWNPVKAGEIRYITLPEANKWFWTQVLMGDRTDNIRGIDGLGPKKAAAIIAACGEDEMKMRAAVLNEYKKQHGKDAEACMAETAKLVWILRKEGKTYDGSEI